MGVCSSLRQRHVDGHFNAYDSTKNRLLPLRSAVMSLTLTSSSTVVLSVLSQRIHLLCSHSCTKGIIIRPKKNVISFFEKSHKTRGGGLLRIHLCHPLNAWTRPTQTPLCCRRMCSAFRTSGDGGNPDSGRRSVQAAGAARRPRSDGPMHCEHKGGSIM